MKKQSIIALVLGVGLIAGLQAQVKYGVSVVAQEKMDFATLKTYSWYGGQPSPLKSVDTQIIAAIDRELASLGLTQATAPATGDVQVAYGVLRRIDSAAKPGTEGNTGQYDVGTLSFTMSQPKTRARWLELRLDKPISTDPAKAEATIKDAVTELFTQYPTRQKPKR